MAYGVPPMIPQPAHSDGKAGAGAGVVLAGWGTREKDPPERPSDEQHRPGPTLGYAGTVRENPVADRESLQATIDAAHLT